MFLSIATLMSVSLLAFTDKPAIARDSSSSLSLQPAIRDPIPQRLLPTKAGSSTSITPPLKDAIPDRLLIGKKIPPLVKPPAREPDKNNLVPPPGEDPYYPVRMDGQPYVLNVDRTVNLTDALNRFYYDPRWRGEVWVPFDQVSTIERATRLMSTWREYNEFSTFRIFNRVNQFFERWSGYGP